MENGLINTYHYDQYGYYEGVVTTQVLDGAALMPPCCIATAPEVKEGFFYKINDTDDGWIAEAKPKSAKDCIGLVVKHEDNSDRGCELKKLMQDFCDADSEHYRVKRGEDLSWTVEAIPPKTFEEVKTEKMQELQNKSASLETPLNKNIVFTSSLGFKVNGDRRSQANLQNLINFYQDNSISYRDYDNNMQVLSKEQLTTILRESALNFENLYNQKWSLETQIKNAKTKVDLSKIKIDYVMSNFKS